MAGRNYDVSLYWAGWHLMGSGIKGFAALPNSGVGLPATLAAQDVASLAKRMLPLLDAGGYGRDLTPEERYSGEVLLGATLAFAALVLPPRLDCRRVGSPTDWETDTDGLWKEVQMFIYGYAPEALEAVLAERQK